MLCLRRLAALACGALLRFDSNNQGEIVKPNNSNNQKVIIKPNNSNKLKNITKLPLYKKVNYNLPYKERFLPPRNESTCESHGYS